MAISFNSVPSTLRVPFVAVEFDNSRAVQGPATLAYRGLIIGQKTAAGTATADTLVKCSSVNQAIALGGRGSQLHRMAAAWFANNRYTEVYLGVLADNGAGVAATKTVTFTGTSTAAGTISLYVGGTLVTTAIASGTAASAVATAVAASVTANLDLPVTAGAATTITTLTARNKGPAGNDLDVRVNYQDGESLPAGITVAIAAGVTGATNPTLTNLIAAAGDSWFHVIAHPYTDATSLTALETELASRAGPTRQIDGMAFTSAAGSQGTISTLGDTRNSQFSSIIAAPGATPVTPPAEFAAAFAAAAAASLNADPARPLQTLPLVGVKAPSAEFTFAERNLMLYDGISTTKVAAGGVVQIERAVTGYQTNAAGASDISYLDVTTIATLMYLRFTFRQRILSRYPRHKLADDGVKFGSGQAILTPLIAKGECFAWFRDMERDGLVGNFEQFKADIIVERNISDPNRMDFLLPPDLINAFIVGAVNMQFRL